MKTLSLLNVFAILGQIVAAIALISKDLNAGLIFFVLIMPGVFAAYYFLKWLLSDNHENRLEIGKAFWLMFANEALIEIIKYMAYSSNGSFNLELEKVSNAAIGDLSSSKVFARSTVNFLQVFVATLVNFAVTYYYWGVTKRMADFKDDGFE
jgi:hypothetical protein